jgi:ferritin-like metal-binding protein YciE
MKLACSERAERHERRPDMTELGARENKLVQYLNEAYGKEKELETALQAHVAMTTRPPYKKRLQQHLTETKRHAREVERRVKKLGGTPQTVPIDAPAAVAKGAGAAVELASRAVAVAKGPLHAIRGTGEQEKMLKNAKSEYSEEHEEIATYTAIETLAEALGDSETAKLARAIRREEESMAGFLLKQIPILTRAVTQTEIPPSERATPNRRRRATKAPGSNGRRTTRPKATRRSR